MKKAYPIVLSPVKNGFVVYVPDFDNNTEGYDMDDVTEMAKDAIGLLGITPKYEGRGIPELSPIELIEHEEDDTVVTAEVDFDECHGCYEQS
ncbi:MAG: hypothetical protein J1E60_02490 [Christensenellaceae bacterium]|nr:hypothetical protein [Christensenellaceae bacterium]